MGRKSAFNIVGTVVIATGLLALAAAPADVDLGGIPLDEMGIREERSAMVSRIPPGTDKVNWEFAVDLAAEIKALDAPPFARTTHADAQWYPDAGLGLFMHWGIHSVKGVQPSWAMIKDYPYGGELHPPERYYALAKEFDPQDYDPDLWIAAAAKAGFTYAVLTAKHHDGYALWPTAYGDMSTRQYLDGRDLLEPYVEACRKHGLKVGFYFSPTDWHYPGYPVGDVDFNHSKRGKYPPIEDPEENQRDFEGFYAYTVGQLHELLTRYGQVDVLWFDGMGWHGVRDIYTEQTLAWIRRLQPGIIMNDRWGSVGDFTTPEWNFPEGRPQGWWENCVSWNGHWGYNPRGRFRPNTWVMDRLRRARAWGGNFLLNVGPAPDGTMPPGFYERCDELAAWMAHSRDALIGAAPSPGDERANVPITTRGNTWYLHVPPKHEGAVEVSCVAKPQAVTLVRTGAPLPHSYADGTLSIEPATASGAALGDVVAVAWTKNFWEKAVRVFEEQDRVSPPPQGAILFVGSSTIRMWDLEKYFPEFETINRGFGGSQFVDVLYHAHRIVLPYRPKTIVLYAGDNDVARGKGAAWVFADFEALIRRIRHAMPDVPIFVLSIKPSVARWELWDTMRQANALIAAFAEGDPRLTYVDGARPLLGPDGRPRADLFIEDGLHFNAQGYAIWTALLTPLLAGE